MEKLKNTKLLGIIGVALTILGAFLPFATVSANILGYKSSVSASFIEGDGVFVLILSAISLLILFADKLSEKVAFFAKLAKVKLILIPTVLSAIVLIVNMANAGNVVGSVSSSIANVSVSYGIGAWVMWLGVAATVVYAFLYKKD